VEREAVLVGIDVGTSKVVALIGEVSRDGRLTIMGHGTVPATGLKKGAIVNIDQTVRSIADAVERAERLSGWKIDRAFVGVGGPHVESLNSTGQVAVTAHHREVTRADIDRAIKVGLGYKMGPLELIDLVGLDTQVRLCEAFYPITLDPRAAAPPLLRRMVAAGLLGRKSGRGFFTYQGSAMFGA